MRYLKPQRGQQTRAKGEQHVRVIG